MGTQQPRRLIRAELLAVGSELTVGEVRDTNGGDLARELTSLGVTVTRLVALRDDLEDVTRALRDALGRVDLVVTSGGLGPTPDDLTRESIAAVCGETPTVDAALERWVRAIFSRRGVRFAERNLKQAWLIPSAQAVPNPNGTAPGWWVDRPDGRVIVALPGPPRELHAMWDEEVVPRLRERGVGADASVRTIRVTGLGESLVAEALGDELLTSANPIVATYARADGIDVRISATGESSGTGSAASKVEALRPLVERRITEAGGRIFGYDEDTWPTVIGRRLGSRRVACLEHGTDHALAALLDDAPWLMRTSQADLRATPIPSGSRALLAATRRLRESTAADVALAVRASERGPDTRVEIAVVTGPASEEAHVTVRTVFLRGAEGHQRAAVAACAELWSRLDPDQAT